jgi:ribosomal protein L37AE/L43A
MPKAKKPTNRRTFVTSTLRRASYRWPPRNEAVKLARVDRGLYKCAHCGGQFKNGQFQVDHKVAVVSVTSGWTDYNDFIERLLCEVDGWQVLCTTCHDIKTYIEDSLREGFKAERKEAEAPKKRGKKNV